MPAHRYVEENGLAFKMSAEVTPEVNLGEFVTCMSLPSMNKAAQSSLETQIRHRQKSKTGTSVAPQKELLVLQIFFKKYKVAKQN